MRKNTPLHIEILIHLLGLLEANQKLSFRPGYFLKQSFSDYSQKKKMYYNSLYRLMKYRYLKRKLFKDVEMFEVTQKGRYKALKYVMKQKSKQK